MSQVLAAHERPDRASCGGTTVASELSTMRTLREERFFADTKQLHLKMLIGGVVLNGTLIGLHGSAGVAGWRVCAMAATFIVFATVQQVVMAWARRTQRLAGGFVTLALLVQVFIGAQMAVTGGLHSALLPALSLMAIQATLLFGPHRISGSLALSMLVIVGVLACLPTELTGPPIVGWEFGLSVVVMFVWIVIMFRSFVGRMLSAHENASCQVDALRETELAAAEAQTRRLQSVGAKVAHELKNPLAAIKGLIQLQARAATDDKTRQRLDVVQSEIARMETILREYLSFARPLEDLEAQSVELGALIADAATVVMGRAEHGKIAVQLGGRPAKVIADPRRLKEAVLNLLSNAVEHTGPGGAITVTTEPDADGGAILTVSDDGRGISGDDLRRLGTSFFTTRAAGTGLGIVLVLGVVAQHGGRVHYASELGRGTTVTIRLPATPVPVESTTQVLTVSALRATAAAS